jgi:hypothetical protein
VIYLADPDVTILHADVIDQAPPASSPANTAVAASVSS